MAPLLTKRWPLWLLLAPVLYVAGVYSSVTSGARSEELRPADAIVVFGAAEYVGRPSPVFKARLDHAAALYRDGLAPMVIVTGGAGADRRFSEGQVGHDYLRGLGVPDHQLIAETQSPDTAESARRVATIMRTNGMRTCLAVSDGYHMFRVKQMLGREGVTVFAAPRPNSRPPGFWKQQGEVWHEITSYTLWLLHLS